MCLCLTDERTKSRELTVPNYPTETTWLLRLGELGRTLGHEVTSERPPHPMSIELQHVAGSLSLSTSKDSDLHSDFASWFLVM